MIHVVRMAALVGGLVLCTALPFLPGRYDGLAVPLSLMAQVAGTIGLVLVPIGIVWFTAERWRAMAKLRRACGRLALAAGAVVWAAMVLAGTMQSGVALGAVVLAIGAVAARRAWRALGAGGHRSSVGPSVAAIYLMVVPSALALVQFAAVDRLASSSRDRAIRNSAPLIAEIEAYRARNGRYPSSLLAAWPDVSPDVAGIPQYLYEPSGEGYNLVFEQFTYTFGTREFVVYNPRGEHEMTSHALDLLQFERAQLARARGYYADVAAPQSGWRIFRFD